MGTPAHATHVFYRTLHTRQQDRLNTLANANNVNIMEVVEDFRVSDLAFQTFLDAYPFPDSPAPGDDPA